MRRASVTHAGRATRLGGAIVAAWRTWATSTPPTSGKRRAPLLDRCLADLAAPRGGVVSRAELARDAFDRDRDRDVDLALAGFVVARVTDRMLDREPSRVAARVRALLGATALTATAPGAP